MLPLRHRRFVFLAGVAASVCAMMFLVRRAANTSDLTGKIHHGAMAGVARQPVLPAQKVETKLASSFQKMEMPREAPVSVRQILPKLDRTIADWRDYRPRRMTVAPYADLAMDFEMTSVRQENGRTIWKGRNALSGAFLVTVATENEWHAVLEIPAASNFEFHVSGQSATVTEKNDPGPCGNDHVAVEAAGSGPANVTAAADAAAGPAAAEPAVHTVDVLFFYDAATLAANGNDARTVETIVAARVESANVVLENSAVSNLRWRYIAAYQVPGYTPTDRLEHDLDEITYTDNAAGRFVADKCALHGVDQAVIFVHGRRDYAGIAWVPNNLGSVAHYSAVVWDSSYLILAHEMAHNFGCRHDRATAGAEDGDGRYWYGYRFTYAGADTGTAMSYAPQRVPYFSNPDVSFAGIPLGVRDDQPKAAWNARVLQDTASLMAGYRTEPLVPVITAQPQSATVREGAGFALTVGAVGSGLAYQWKKNGVDLPGANSWVYSKSNASEADEGVYNVVVSNPVGQAASASASVAISETAEAAPAPASGGNSTSSAAGGGGGGAMSGTSTLALLALLATAGMRRSRLNRSSR